MLLLLAAWGGRSGRRRAPNSRHRWVAELSARQLLQGLICDLLQQDQDRPFSAAALGDSICLP